MANDKTTEIRNKDTVFERDVNSDGSKIQEVVEDGKVIAEIRNKETIFEKDTNADNSPIKEVASKK
jgi:hypothetical protein